MAARPAAAARRPGGPLNRRPSALLLGAALRRRLPLTVVEAFAVALSVALLCAAGATVSSLLDGGAAQRERLGAPDVLLTVWAGDPGAAGRAVAGALVERGHARSVEGPFAEGAGGLRTDGRDLGARFTAVPDGPLPRWLDVLSGTVPARGLVAVERGAAEELGLAAGDRLTLTTASAAVETRVSALVGDLDGGDYSMTGTARAYLGRDVASALGLDRAADHVTLGVHATPGHAGALRRAALDAAPSVQDVGQSPVGAISGASVLLLSVVVGAVVLFGAAALACTLLFLAGAARADVLVRERWLGRLRAVGWSVRGVRRLLVALHVPALVLGAAVGAVAGLLVAQRLVAAIAPSFGFHAGLAGHPGLVLAAVVAGVWLLACLGLRGASRGLRTAVIADQLDARPHPSASRGGDGRRGGAVRRSVSALLWTRRSRTVVTVVLTAAGAWAIGVATLVAGTLQQATGDPAFFGVRYDWSVDLPDTMTPQQVEQAVAALRGVPAISSVTPQITARARLLPGPRVTLRLLPPRQEALPVSLVSGRLPASDREVVVATDLASSRGLAVGSELTLSVGGRQARVTVVGTRRDLVDMGEGVTGLPGLATALLRSPVPTSVLLERAGGVAPAAARSAAVAALGGRLVLQAAADGTRVPFAGAFRALLAVLGGSLALLGGAVAAHLTATAAMEHRRAFAILAALGAPPRMRRGLLAGVAWRLAVVPVVAGLLAGLVTGAWAVGAASSTVGGVDPYLTWRTAVLALAAALAGPLLGTVLPVARALRTPPAAVLSSDRT